MEVHHSTEALEVHREIGDDHESGARELGKEGAITNGCGGYYPVITADSASSFINVINDCLSNNVCPEDGDIGCWDVSYITDMRAAFDSKEDFNEDISMWDTAKVTTMRGMFYYAKTFDQDISYWNTTSVSDMNRMFDHAYIFNQPIGRWDVSSVTDMGVMFGKASSFNQPLEYWDVAKVTLMNLAMAYTSFNQCLSSWASKVPDNVYLKGMFDQSYCTVGETPQVDVSPWCQTVSNGCPTFIPPTEAPTPGPTPSPTPGSTPLPTPGPTASPTPGPTPSPTPGPTASPTASPTPGPTPSPTPAPTPSPTPGPTPSPTASPTPGPTPSPTSGPTPSPTPGPTQSPTPGPTQSPTPGPTQSPTPGPTSSPTASPTPGPTTGPTTFLSSSRFTLGLSTCGPCDNIFPSSLGPPLQNAIVGNTDLKISEVNIVSISRDDTFCENVFCAAGVGRGLQEDIQTGVTVFIVTVEVPETVDEDDIVDSITLASEDINVAFVDVGSTLLYAALVTPSPTAAPTEAPTKAPVVSLSTKSLKSNKKSSKSSKSSKSGKSSESDSSGSTNSEKISKKSK